MNKSKFLYFTFILVFLFSLSSRASEPRALQSGSGGGSGSGSGSGQSTTGYGSTPVYEEQYEQPPVYGGGTPPVYEEYYEKPPQYEEVYEEYVPPVVYEEEEEVYEEYVPPVVYEEEQEEYKPPVYGGGGYGNTPIYEEYYNEQPEYQPPPTEVYEETGIYYGEQPIEQEYAPGTKPPMKYPPSYLTGYIVDIHFLAGDPNFQYIAYHYCQELYPGYSQCDIYNGTSKNSKLMATEMVVSREIFETLPMAERKYWHSHEFAVKSGLLVLPDVSPEEDLAAMSSVINSYGKVTDFWHSYQSFPYGGAKLAYGLGEASQIIPEVARQMDQELGLSTTWQERAQARSGLQAQPKVEGADEYLTTGQYPQYVTQMFDVQTIGVAEETPEGGEQSEEAVGEPGEQVQVQEGVPEETVGGGPEEGVAEF